MSERGGGWVGLVTLNYRCVLSASSRLNKGQLCMTKYLNIREYVSVYAPYNNNEDFYFYFYKAPFVH